jgi:hypothetical protein
MASISGLLDHTHTYGHTVELLWTSDQPVEYVLSAYGDYFLKQH